MGLRHRCILITLLAALPALVSCSNPLGGKSGSDFTSPPSNSGSKVWDFSNPAEYTYSSSHIEVSGNKASLKQLDSAHSTAAEFNSGTHYGTAFTSGKLTIDTSVASAELDASWAPQMGSLKGYWKMNNDWNDSSGFGNNGTAEADATFTTTAKVGSHAGTFDGAGNDRVTIADDDALDNSAKMTFSIWVRTTTCDASFRPIFSKRVGDGNNHSYVLFANACGVTVDLDSSNNRFYGGDISRDRWTHVAVVYDGTLVAAQRAKVYIDGVLRTTASENSTSIPNYTSTLRIGGIQPDGGLSPFQGDLDEFAIWSTALTADEVATIHSRQVNKFVGDYRSPILDLGASGAWQTLSSVSSLPFLKEMTGSDGNETSAGYSSISAGLMTNLVGYWRMNETAAGSAPGGTDFEDRSANNFHGTRSGAGVTLGATGRFGKAADLDGSSYITLSDPFTMIPAASTGLTFSAWVKPGNISADSRFMSLPRNGTGTAAFAVLVGQTQRKFTAIFRASGGGAIFVNSTSNFPSGQYYHVAVTAEAGMGTLYVNGAVEGTSNLVDLAETLTFDNAMPARLGSATDGGGAYLYGSLDEVGLWSRPLSAAEILQLYRRGGNRVKYQVRSCDDAACSGESWMGSTGSTVTYLSELHNNTSINGAGDGDGAVKTGSLGLAFGDFSAAGLAVANNRYFQYRAVLESDDADNLCGGQACLPEVNSITIGPTGRYYGGAPSISNLVPASYSALSNLVISSGGTCSPAYQLSPDGTNYYYWSGAAWSPATLGLAHSASAAATQNNLAAFSTLTGPGSFYFKAFLPSDTTQTCELSSLQLNYTP